MYRDCANPTLSARLRGVGADGRPPLWRTRAERARRSAALHVLPYARCAVSRAVVPADRRALSERSRRADDARAEAATRRQGALGRYTDAAGGRERGAACGPVGC